MERSKATSSARALYMFHCSLDMAVADWDRIREIAYRAGREADRRKPICRQDFLGAVEFFGKLRDVLHVALQRFC